MSNADIAPSKDRLILGIALMMGFIITGPFIDLFAKLATAAVPIAQIAAARFLFQGLLIAPVAALLGRLTKPAKGDIALYLARGALILLSTACITGAVKFMPIADAIAIFFVEPFFLALMGWFFLGEALGPRRITACLIGFFGALLVIQPSFASVGWPAFLPLGTAVFFALYLLLTRTMAQRIDPLAMQTYTSAAALMVAVPILIAFNGSGIAFMDPIMPTGLPLLWLFLGGVAAAVAHLFLTYAFRFAPVTLLGPMHYMEIVTASILGYIVFGDLFNGVAAIGVLIIIGSGLYLVWRERQLIRIPAQQPPQDT